MAKIYGLFGSMTGKVADVVMAVRNGEQIARKYQPVVSNPSTPAQVATRARLKLMSQLSAIMAPVIAIPRVGTVSSRNLFVKKNFSLTSYDNDTANIELNSVQLTDSVVAIPGLTASRAESLLTVSLAQADYSVSRMVYVVFVKQGDEMRYRTSAVVNERGENGRFETSIPSANAEELVYAYGIRDNNENSRAIFGNLTAPTAETVAKLIVTRSLTLRDITLTETQSTTVAAPNANMRDVDEEAKNTRKSK